MPSFVLTDIRPLHFKRIAKANEDWPDEWLQHQNDKTTPLYGSSEYVTNNRLFIITRRKSGTDHQPVWVVRTTKIFNMLMTYEFHSNGIEHAEFPTREEAVVALEQLAAMSPAIELS